MDHDHGGPVSGRNQQIAGRCLVAGVLAVCALAPGPTAAQALRSGTTAEQGRRAIDPIELLATDPPRHRPPVPARPLDPGARPTTLGFHRPNGSTAGLPGAAVTATLDRAVRITGRAVFRLSRGVAVTGAGLRYEAGGRALSAEIEATVALPGRSLPLEYRGRERRIVLAVSVPRPGAR